MTSNLRDQVNSPAEGNLFSEKGVEMSLCLGNGLCALLELCLNFLSFTIGQELVFVRFVAGFAQWACPAQGEGSPGLWGLQGLGSLTGLEAETEWRLCALSSFVTRIF